MSIQLKNIKKCYVVAVFILDLGDFSNTAKYAKDYETQYKSCTTFNDVLDSGIRLICSKLQLSV